MNDNRDGIRFWNSGDVFGDDSRLFEPGEKEVRNPAIAMAVRRTAMCEQAGTDMRMMREEWQKLGHPAPTYKNDRAWKAFEFFIPELDKEVDMASDLLQAMFEGTPQVTGEVSGQDTRQVSGEVGTKLALSRHQVLNPLIEAGLIEMTIPDKPQSSRQKYRLTNKGRNLLKNPTYEKAE